MESFPHVPMTIEEQTIISKQQTFHSKFLGVLTTLREVNEKSLVVGKDNGTKWKVPPSRFCCVMRILASSF